MTKRLMKENQIRKEQKVINNDSHKKNSSTKNMENKKFTHHLQKVKLARRRKLAQLSFPEKILILVRLQKLANDINKIKGRKPIVIWKV